MISCHSLTTSINFCVLLRTIFTNLWRWKWIHLQVSFRCMPHNDSANLVVFFFVFFSLFYSLKINVFRWNGILIRMIWCHGVSYLKIGEWF